VANGLPSGGIAEHKPGALLVKAKPLSGGAKPGNSLPEQLDRHILCRIGIVGTKWIIEITDQAKQQNHNE
jgi:hypothetical protein